MQEMKTEYLKPEEIEKRSFEIISKELDDMGITLEEGHERVIKRCIHTTADFDYAGTMYFSENAVSILKELIKNGTGIVTDTQMALSGINKRELEKYGCSYVCHMSDENVARIAKETGKTRAAVSMELEMEKGL
ncbi:MAG: precorrin-8X methylmutase, partial [Lachnospiraceae bacterium]|nr:precorrin-8X methylmutase [Lachnospiraceae bacterium]